MYANIFYEFTNSVSYIYNFDYVHHFLFFVNESLFLYHLLFKSQLSVIKYKLNKAHYLDFRLTSIYIIEIIVEYQVSE